MTLSLLVPSSWGSELQRWQPFQRQRFKPIMFMALKKKFLLRLRNTHCHRILSGPVAMKLRRHLCSPCVQAEMGKKVGTGQKGLDFIKLALQSGPGNSSNPFASCNSMLKQKKFAVQHHITTPYYFSVYNSYHYAYQRFWYINEADGSFVIVWNH